MVERERLAAMMQPLHQFESSVPAWARQRLRGFERTVMSRHVLLHHHADRIFAALERVGVAPVPLKGYVLTREIYPRPGVRDMTDLDLLVRREEVPACGRALTALGWHPPPHAQPDRVPGRSGSINAMLFTPPGRIDASRHHVHLHWDVFNSTLPTALALRALPLDEIRRAARPVERGVRLLDRVHLAVLIAEHAFKHSFHELVMLVDLAHVMSGVEEAAVRRTAGRWGLSLQLSLALQLIERLRSGGGVPVEGIRGLDGRWFVRSVLENRRWNGLSGLGYLSLMPGVRGRARFLREMFFPAREAVRVYGRVPGVRETLRRCRRVVRMATSAR